MDFLQRLQEATNEHETTDKEKSAELAYLDGRLKHATEVIQVATVTACAHEWDLFCNHSNNDLYIL
jgi:hypothetical protein